MAGNIIAGFNIGGDTSGVTGYYNGNGEAALEYLAVHEVAHDSTAGITMNSYTGIKNFNDFTQGTSNWANENFANTVALATMEALGLSLGHYDPTITAGPQTPTGAKQRHLDGEQ